MIRCTRCDKRLSRKSARLIDGVVQCSSCMWKPRKSGEAGTVKTAQTGLVYEHAVGVADAPALGNSEPHNG